MLDTLGANIGIVRFVIAATVVLLITVPTAFLIIFLEMKVIAFVNLRLGPNRIGPWGTLASVFHGLKVLAKEDFTPTGVDVPVFTLAPVVVYLASVMTLLVVPFAPGLLRLRHGPRAALLLRRRRARRGRADDGRLVRASTSTACSAACARRPRSSATRSR